MLAFTCIITDNLSIFRDSDNKLTDCYYCRSLRIVVKYLYCLYLVRGVFDGSGVVVGYCFAFDMVMVNIV